MFRKALIHWGVVGAIFASTVISQMAFADELPGGVQLGMSAEQLSQAIPALSKVRRPTRMTGGLVGAWSGPAVNIAGVSMTPTFFFAEAQLRRIEYLEEPASNAQFDSLLAWGKTNWGEQITSYGPKSVYASWVKDEIDAYLQIVEGSSSQLRLVIKARAIKDESQL